MQKKYYPVLGIVIVLVAVLLFVGTMPAGASPNLQATATATNTPRPTRTPAPTRVPSIKKFPAVVVHSDWAVSANVWADIHAQTGLERLPGNSCLLQVEMVSNTGGAYWRYYGNATNHYVHNDGEFVPALNSRMHLLSVYLTNSTGDGVCE